MAYVNVAEWKPEQVTEWLKGLDNNVFQYVHSFLNNEVNGKQLLNLRTDDLDHLGVLKLGHQELILEAVEHLRNFHYELDRENLQFLSLRLACQARSLYNELKLRSDLQPLSTQNLADVANVIMAVKPLVCWLERSPFSGQLSYQERKDDLLHLSLQIATCAQRDRFADKPVEEIRSSCKKLAELGDEIIQDIVDPLILQPASLDLVTLKKRAIDDLGFFILPSFHGIHQIAEINFSSPAHQCGKIENGDEIVQVNYQTVVGWQTKKLMALFEESPTEVFLTLKKRPRHNKVYGQIYMKPYRLPSKKRLAPYSRWNDNLPSPRPELLTIPDFEIPLSKGIFKKGLPQSHSLFECNSSLCTLTTEEKKEEGMTDKFESVCKEGDDDDDNEDDNDDESFLPETADEGQASPTSMRLYLPKPRVTVQRRATVTGASPTSKRAPVNVEQFWAELRLERHWRECAAIESGNKGKGDLFQMRDKSISVGNSLSFHLSRPCTTLGIETVVSNTKSPDEHEALMSGENSCITTETMQNIAMEAENIADQGAVYSCDKNCSFNLEENKIGSVSFVEKNALIENDEILNNVENDLYTIVSHANSLCVASPEICEEHICEESTCKTTGSDFSVINFPVIDQCDSEIDNSSEIVSQDFLEHNKMLNGGNESSITLQKYNLDNSNGNVCGNTDKYSCNQLTQISGKERGRLDKSYSTPAYDLLESITFLEKSANFHYESSITDRYENPGDGTVSTKVNNSILQTHVEQDSLPCVPNATYTQPTLFNDGFKTDSFKECDNSLTIQNKCVSCVLKPNSESLSSEEVNNTSIGSHLQYSSLKKQPSGNKISVLPVESNSENYNSSLFTQMDTDLYHEKKIPGNITDSQCSFNVNVHSERSDITYVTETKCISTPDVISDKTLATYNSIKEVGSHSSKDSEISNKSVDFMCKVKKNSKVSPKCETTKWSLKITPTHDTEKYGLGSESVAQKTATKCLPTSSIPSPWSTRKGNSLLSKRRSVSAKEIGCGDNDGWLLHRFRSSGAGATWLNMWFILKGVTFYGFKTPQATKAHVMIVLPGFTVSVAEEVKSRSFAFKIYHTGTVFYFSADTADEFSVWLACLSMAATPQKAIKTRSGLNYQTPYFSETDDDLESQKESEPETSIYKHFPYQFEHGSSSQQHGKGHQSSITESNKTDSPKLFGSRKKIAQKSETMGSTMCTELLEPASSSLDRKYLNFLGGIRNSNVPVPTAQFRSYRRAPKNNLMDESKLHEGKSYQIFDNVCLPRRNDKLTSSFIDSKADTQDMPINNLKRSTMHTEDLLLPPQDVLLSDGNKSCNVSVISTEKSDNFVTKHKIGMHLKVESKEKSIHQSHKLLKVHNVRSHHIHASNPNLHLSSNMLNYRLAAERLRKFGLGHNQQEGTSGFVTLENLMSRQEEEKCKQQQLNLNSMSSDGFTSISSRHFLDPTHANLVKDNRQKLKDFEVSGSSGVPCETTIYNEQPAVPACKKGNCINMHQYSNTSQDIRVNPSVKHTSSTLAQNSALAVQKVVSRVETNSAISSNRKRTNLKAAAQYHPPPISKVLAGGRKVHPKEDGPKMKLAFEMYLGENTLSTAPNKDTFCKSSKFRNLFLFSRNQNVKYSHGDTSVSICGEQRKQLSGSPRLHRTFPWEKPVYDSRKMPNEFNFNHVTRPSFSLVPPSWTRDLSDPQSDCSIPKVKPMMGVTMICKKSCKVVMASSSSPQSSSAPDYPGLEYPPVFEPETYTLSDANTLLKSRHHHMCANNISCACSTLSNNQTKKEQ